jgi:ACDE family multidrug resistance protein
MGSLARGKGILAQSGNRSAGRRRPLYLDRNLLVIFSVTLVALAGVSSIAPALPAVSRHFHITAAHVGWLISVFTIPGIVFTPLMGLAGDRIGRKKVLVPSLILFAVAGGACTLVGEFSHLLVLRFLQGVGAAAIGALNLALIGDLYSGDERVTAFGYNTAVISAAAAGYPLIGGALVLVGWQFPFIVALIGLPVGALVVFALDAPHSGGHGETIGVYFRNLGAAVRRIEIGGLFLGSLANFITIYGAMVTFLPFLIERSLHGSAVDYGVVMAANAVGSVGGSIALGHLVRRFPHRIVALGALAVLIVTTAAVPFLPSLATMIAVAAVLGVAMGMFLTMVQSQVAERAPVQQRGAVLALNGMMIRLGQTLGPILMSVLLTVGGMVAVFAGGAVVLLLVVPLIAIALRPAPARPEPE